MQHIMQDVEDFALFLEILRATHINLVKFQQHPNAPDTFILTAGRHNRPYIMRHLFEDTDASEVEEIIIIAGYKAAAGEWTIENSPSASLDKLREIYQNPVHVP